MEEIESSSGNTSKARLRNLSFFSQTLGVGGTWMVSEDRVLKTVRVVHLDIKSGISCKMTPTFSGCSISL